MLPLAKVCCGNWAARVKLSRCWHTWLCFKLWNTSSPLNLRCVSCGCPQALRNISCNQPLQIYVPILMMVIMTEEVTTGLMQSPVACIYVSTLGHCQCQHRSHHCAGRCLLIFQKSNLFCILHPLPGVAWLVWASEISLLFWWCYFNNVPAHKRKDCIILGQREGPKITTWHITFSRARNQDCWRCPKNTICKK